MKSSCGCGTSHFVSKQSADAYYREMGYPNADRALEEGVIHLGMPVLNPGETLEVIQGEGRYRIVCSAKPVVAAPRSLGDEIALLVADGDKVLLPKTQLARYAEIKRMLQTSGGRYNAKGYFTFPLGIDVDEVLSALQSGKVLNGKKESQSFFTPPDLGYEVCNSAGPLEGKRILEPSAGDGALADIAEAAGADVVVIENYPPNIARLQAKGYDVIARDFLTVSPEEIGFFDAVVANPPFTKNQDIDHVLHMWSFLKPGGVLSAITSQSWRNGSQKKQRMFQDFLDSHNAETIEVEAGAFKESGTTVGTMRIRIVKPEHVVSVADKRSFSSQTAQGQLGLSF